MISRQHECIFIHQRKCAGMAVIETFGLLPDNPDYHFMNDGVLSKFRSSQGWKAGVDGSVALATLGAGGAIDSETAKKPIIGFIFSNKGLMYNLTFEGSKITKLNKDK